MTILSAFYDLSASTALCAASSSCAFLATAPKTNADARDQSRIAKRARQIGHLVTHVPAHRTYRAAMEDFIDRGLLHQQAPWRYKYLGSFIAPFLSIDQRRRGIQFHYEHLIRALAPAAQLIWSCPNSLWRRYDPETGHVLEVILDQPANKCWKEGEQQLRFLMDGRTLFMLTFTILPADLLGLPGTSALFIGGLQGGQDCRQEIRTAAKLNNEIAPATMLFLATRALAAPLGVDHIAGISTAAQPALEFTNGRPAFNYDAFWEGIDGTPVNADIHALPVRESTDEPVGGAHRSRTRRRRLYRAAVALEIETAVRAQFGLNAPAERARPIRIDASPFPAFCAAPAEKLAA